jgi:integrase
LQAGVPVKVVSERLGHHNVFVTMTTYAHVLPAMDAEAVHKFSAYVFADAADEQDGPLR